MDVTELIIYNNVLGVYNRSVLESRLENEHVECTESGVVIISVVC